MIRSVRGIPLGILSLALAVGAATADVIHLKTGKVEGTVIQRTDAELVVMTRAGKVTLKTADVVRIERKSTPLSLYREMAGKVARNDAAGHFALGLWCTEHRLFREARQEFRTTLRIDPNHKGARERLGYVLKGGKWMTLAEAKKADGFVLHNGKWVTAEERDAAKRQQAVLAHRRRIRQAIAKGPMTVDAVGARITAALGRKAGVDGERALLVVLRELTKEADEAKRDRTSNARIALVDAIAQEPSAEAAELLQRTAIQDRSELVRTAAIKALAQQNRVDNTAYFVGLLRRFTGPRYRVQGNKRTRAFARQILRRAAVALGGLDDPRAIPALANALTVRFHISENADEIPPMTLGFSTPRVAGGNVVTDSHGNQMILPAQSDSKLRFPGSEDAKAAEDGLFFNEAAYSALRKLTKQDFSLDKRAWLAWWYRNRHNLVD